MLTETGRRRRHFGAFTSAVCVGALFGCVAPDPSTRTLTAEAPLHLEDRLDRARVEGSEPPAEAPQAIVWSFDEPQLDWRPVQPRDPRSPPTRLEQIDGVLRLRLDEGHRLVGSRLLGGAYVELPAGWRREDFSHVEIRARTEDRLRFLGLEFNLDPDNAPPGDVFPFYAMGDRGPLITDGTVQTYERSLDVVRGNRELDGAWTHLGIGFNTQDGVDRATLDILSVKVVPREGRYADEGLGVLTDWKRAEGASHRDSPYRRTLYTHAPGRISYRIAVPERARLDVGLGVASSDAAVTFRVLGSFDGGDQVVLLEESVSNPRTWAQRTLDLGRHAGRTFDLTLAADSPRAGAVALWASPTLSGVRVTERPNVILYVIDGGSADYMSAYRYNRRTTPNLERLAAEGAIFERAYSNSAWTRPSTASFLTSLHHSVLGGLRAGANPVPEGAVTLAEHLRRAGYQTAQFTSNSNAGRISRLERGADSFREAGVDNFSTSSVDLHRNFWRWRREYPAEPFYVHFQPTDVHNDHTPVAPFAGTYIDPERRQRFERWLEQVNAIPERPGFGIREALLQLGIDQKEFWTAYRDLHDESMAHQDHQIGQLVERLRARGEWENTLLVVASDHGVAAGAWDYHLLLRDPQPEHIYHDDLAVPILRSGVSHIPLLIVWPGRIPPGRRFPDPVSMIDVLPTILDLAELAPPEVVMGRSLASLLQGHGTLAPQPVIFDEVAYGDDGEPRGRIEVIDGRWGASLEIGWSADRPEGRPAPLLLFDLWEDPEAVSSLHDERPDLVDRYRAFLEERWRAHQSLATRFTPSEEAPLSTDQLETLRALGYIQ